MYVIPMLCFSDIFVLLGLVGFSLILGILELLKFDNTCNSAFLIVLLFGATCMLYLCFVFQIFLCF